MAAKRERLVTGRKFSVDRVAVPTKGGVAAPRELVVHPGSVVLLPVLPDGRVVLIENRRFAVDQVLLELPAGTLELGEDPAACAARELLEETGYRAGRIEPLCRFFSAPGFCTEEMHAFLATELVEEVQALEETEQIEVRPMSLEDVEAKIGAGEIRDAKTLAAVLFWLRFRRSAER